jgi:hypothetical protein
MGTLGTHDLSKRDGADTLLSGRLGDVVTRLRTATKRHAALELTAGSDGEQRSTASPSVKESR